MRRRILAAIETYCLARLTAQGYFASPEQGRQMLQGMDTRTALAWLRSNRAR